MPKNSVLFFQGDPADAVFIVQTGSIAIILSSTDGRELMINEIRPGDCFGELGVLTEQPRSTSAFALEDSTLILIPRQIFLETLHAEPELVWRFIELLALRLNEGSQRESALAFLDGHGRLARVLIQLNDQAQDKGYVTVSQDELARRTGLTRQTVAKILGHWRRAGWLITGRGRIMLLNMRELSRFG